MQENKTWYVVYTRPRWEKKVATTLVQKGIENYCPLNKVLRQWSDRKKVVYEPLFKGYVFINVSEGMKWDIKKIDGIINYVHWLGKPAKVKESEIDSIRRFLNEFEEVFVSAVNLDVNTAVVVKQGVLMNYKGIIMEVSGSRAKVKIDSLGMYLTAYFDKNNLEVDSVSLLSS
ncbi:MAG: UpxY family transcription antiterminator [Ferruginibacter sp.]